MTLTHIGDVVVHRGEPPDGNPYKNNGGLLGPERKAALQCFVDGATVDEFTLWHAPSCGGARRITAAEVDWKTSGLVRRSRMKVINAGFRERQALLKWWGAADRQAPAPYHQMLDTVVFDPSLDALIIPDIEQPLTIAAINELEGGYGTLRGKTAL